MVSRVSFQGLYGRVIVFRVCMGDLNIVGGKSHVTGLNWGAFIMRVRERERERLTLALPFSLLGD